MKHAASHHRRGFTVIELIVVVGIIALLIGLAVPMLVVSYRKANKTKAAADLAALKTALDAYHTDFGDYPRAGLNDGFAVLGLTLFSPGGPAPVYDATKAYEAGECVAYNGAENLAFKHADVSIPPSNTAFWKQFNYSDFKPGPGFKIRQGGKVYGPYIQNDRFRIRGLAVLDANENPIAYFSATPRRQKMNEDNYLYLWDTNDGPAPAPFVYDVGQSLEFFVRPGETTRANAAQRVAAMLGDFSGDGQSTNFDKRIDAGETPINEPYLLWSAGANGLYGPVDDGTGITRKDIDNCDDITTFR